MRSAWLAALLSEGRLVAHDCFMCKDLKVDGWSDPAAACCFPRQTLAQPGPLVIVQRNHIDAKHSFERWLGEQVDHWDLLLDNYTLVHKACRDRSDVLFVDYDDLDTYATCETISQKCTGIKLSYERWELFRWLKIEQDLARVKQWLSQAL